LKTRVDAWGPPPLETMTRLFFEMNAADITGVPKATTLKQSILSHHTTAEDAWRRSPA
jgi:hypothetical protein